MAKLLPKFPPYSFSYCSYRIILASTWERSYAISAYSPGDTAPSVSPISVIMRIAQAYREENIYYFIPCTTYKVWLKIRKKTTLQMITNQCTQLALFVVDLLDLFLLAGVYREHSVYNQLITMHTKQQYSMLTANAKFCSIFDIRFYESN